MTLFLQQCSETKESKKVQASLANEVFTLRSDKATLIQAGNSQRSAAKQAIAKLNSRLAANKGVAQTTPAKRISTLVRDNLKLAGFLPLSYKPDTTNKTAVAIYDSVENRAILESTGLVSVERSAWNELADGYTRLQQDSTQAAKELSLCDSLKRDESGKRVIAQNQLDQYQGKTIVGKTVRKGRNGLTLIGAVYVLVSVVKLFL